MRYHLQSSWLRLVATILVCCSVGTSLDAATPPAPEAEFSAKISYDLPALLLDIRGPNSSKTLLKLRLAVALDSKRDVQQLEQVNPRIMNALITMLRAMPVQDLEGPGLERVKSHILELISAQAPAARVRGVMFKELNIQ